MSIRENTGSKNNSANKRKNKKNKTSKGIEDKITEIYKEKESNKEENS